MGILVAVVGVFAFLTIVFLLGVKAARMQEEAEQRAREEKRKSEMISIISNYPVLELTSQELEKIPFKDELPSEFFKSAPFGSRYRWPRDEDTGIIVVAEIIKGEDIPVEKAGAYLLSGIPERTIKRWRAKIVD